MSSGSHKVSDSQGDISSASSRRSRAEFNYERMIAEKYKPMLKQLCCGDSVIKSKTIKKFELSDFLN
jgi:hypothetical protein